jgi:hypothetical protein
MLRAPYQVDPEFYRKRRPVRRVRIQKRPAPPSQLERDAARDARLDEAFIALDARLRTLHLWSTGMREMSSSPELDWCVACLADVRSALYQLHVHVVNQGLPLTPHGPAIVSYLSEAYVWCGDVLEDVQTLVQQLRYGTPVSALALADDSSAYIDEFLEPLFREMRLSCRAMGGGQPMTRALLPLAERLHVAIVSLNWVLRAARSAA